MSLKRYNLYPLFMAVTFNRNTLYSVTLSEMNCSTHMMGSGSNEIGHGLKSLGELLDRMEHFSKDMSNTPLTEYEANTYKDKITAQVQNVVNLTLSRTIENYLHRNKRRLLQDVGLLAYNKSCKIILGDSFVEETCEEPSQTLTDEIVERLKEEFSRRGVPTENVDALVDDVIHNFPW